MKKIFKKMILVLLAVMMVFSVAACKGDQGGDNPGGNDPGNNPGGGDDGTVTEKPSGTITPDVSGNEVAGIHQINVTDSSIDFVVGGSSEYRIVVPTVKEYAEITTGADEIVNFISQSTGAVLDVVNDEGLTYSASSKFISLGDTALLSQAGIEVDKEELTRSGYRIISKDNSVFLIGGGDFGTLYSAYEFLKHMIGFETYAADEVVFDRYTTLKLKKFDVLDVPDFTYRMTNYGTERNDNQFAQRMRMNQESLQSGKVWMGPSGMGWHNTFAYLPKEKYSATHPKWYSVDGTQLCFYARGDEEEQALMFETFMNSFMDVIKAYPDVENITITQQDINTWCTCPVCSAEKEKYGTDAATIVKFCNKVSDALPEYFEKNGLKERNINICFFAYHKTETAPVRRTETGYEAIDSDVICRDNVYVFYAPIFANYTYSFYDGKNLNAAETMDAWCVLSKKLYLWIYSTNFGNYLAPYNSFNSMQDNYQFSKAHNACYMFDQGQWNQNMSTGFGNLKAYLNAKLQWDVTLDFNQLVRDFFDNYFKDASDEMMDVFNYYRTWMAYLENDLGIDGVLSQNITTSRYFPKPTIDTFLALFDKAYAAIEPLKSTNSTLYNTLYDRICLETIAYRKMDIDLYSSKYTIQQQARLKKEFKDDCMRIGVSKATESSDINGVWENWGL